jgi:hypothetical protein
MDVGALGAETVRKHAWADDFADGIGHGISGWES